MGFIQFFIDNWETIIAFVLSLQVAATIVVGMTDTPKDDVIVGKIYKLIEALAGVTEKTKQKAGDVQRE